MISGVARRFDELKITISESLKSIEASTSFTLGSTIDAQPTNICDCLYRMTRQKLVVRSPLPREKPGRPKYAYTLTERGQNRLSYLKYLKSKRGESSSGADQS
jgi:DNA-binding PadR family transcriptional regulator